MPPNRIRDYGLAGWIVAATALYLWQFRDLLGPILNAVGLNAVGLG